MFEKTYDWEVELSLRWLVSIFCGMAAAAITEAIYALGIAAAFTQFYTISGAITNGTAIPNMDEMEQEQNNDQVPQAVMGMPGTMPVLHLWPAFPVFGGVNTR